MHPPVQPPLFTCTQLDNYLETSLHAWSNNEMWYFHKNTSLAGTPHFWKGLSRTNMMKSSQSQGIQEVSWECQGCPFGGGGEEGAPPPLAGCLPLVIHSVGLTYGFSFPGTSKKPFCPPPSLERSPECSPECTFLEISPLQPVTTSIHMRDIVRLSTCMCLTTSTYGTLTCTYSMWHYTCVCNMLLECFTCAYTSIHVCIAPDVTNVDNALRVVNVDVQTLSADISFPVSYSNDGIQSRAKY
jgi:hypothetical protein